MCCLFLLKLPSAEHILCALEVNTYYKSHGQVSVMCLMAEYPLCTLLLPGGGGGGGCP